MELHSYTSQIGMCTRDKINPARCKLDVARQAFCQTVHCIERAAIRGHGAEHEAW